MTARAIANGTPNKNMNHINSVAWICMSRRYVKIQLRNKAAICITNLATNNLTIGVVLSIGIINLTNIS